ncbi:MAG: hypothetical protein ACQEUB_08995, partial [Thermodesulfobacteriota bacterium]
MLAKLASRKPGWGLAVPDGQASDRGLSLVLRLKNIASIFGNRFYFIYKFIKFEYRNPKFETIGINDLKNTIQNKEKTQID